MFSNNRDLLIPFGWNDFFENQCAVLEEGWVPARVIGEEKNLFRLQVGTSVYWGSLSGRFRFNATGRLALPATGDWVACTPDPSSGRAVIQHLFNRKSCLSRKMVGSSLEEQILAANIDTVFVTTSANADLNLRRIERYLTLVWDSGAVPVVLLTKVDLATDVESLITELQGVALGVDIYPVSALTGFGLTMIEHYMGSAKTVVLIGSSGVGKSTLVNHLLGNEVIRTQEVREKDDKGRHTTTARYLFQLPSGGMLIDTPGMRELQLSDHEEGLGQLFSDIESLAASCRFSDCSHASEPGCTVKAALESGALSEERMQSYEKLKKEILFQKRKMDKVFASQTRAQWKSMAKAMRAMKKEKP